MWDNTTYSQRKLRLPDDWELVRARILDRDAYTCALCGAYGTHVDHINSGSTGHVSDDELQTLCASCHARKSAREGGHARAAAIRAARRPQRRHPGLKY